MTNKTKRPVSKDSKEEAAIAEIMDAIGINEDSVELPLDAGLRSELRRINNAINALNDLRESDVGELSHYLSQFIGEMRAFRARKFEKLVDWEAIAKEG